MSTRVCPLWDSTCLVALPALTAPLLPRALAGPGGVTLLFAVSTQQESLLFFSSYSVSALDGCLLFPPPPLNVVISVTNVIRPSTPHENMVGRYGEQLSSRAGIPDNFLLPHSALIQLEGTWTVRRPGTSLFLINLFLLLKIICQSYLSYLSDAGAFLPSFLMCVLRYL